MTFGTGGVRQLPVRGSLGVYAMVPSSGPSPKELHIIGRLNARCFIASIIGGTVMLTYDTIPYMYGP